MHRALGSLLVVVTAACGLAQSGPAPAQTAERRVAIDLDHILRGEINRRGDLVGLHHAPSAPESMRARGIDCRVEFRWTSPGGSADVRTAQVLLRDPQTGRVVLEKFSTLFPSDWTRAEIEQAIREAYADARARNGIESNGRWEGRTERGIRIGGYLDRDGEGIATAYPIYSPPRGSRSRR